MDDKFIGQIRKLDGKLFSALDLNFAAFVCRISGREDNYPLFLAAALAANASIQYKHSCIDLSELSGDLSSYFEKLAESGVFTPEITASLKLLPIPENWVEKLVNIPQAVASPEAKLPLPLVLDGSYLYIYRDWLCERTLAREIRRRCCSPAFLKVPVSGESICGISKYFRPMDESGQVDWQQVAIFTALRRNFTVISGGPGTGKTTVAAALCALLLEYDSNINITLCAPTGKAQARMRESILAQVDELDCKPDTKALLRQLPVATIHRLLGGRPGTPRFRWNANHKLALEVLIVDEASMISQSLMRALFAALPENTKIIMLGDMLQLASVEAGMVLGDFCRTAGTNCFNAEFVGDFEQVFPGMRGLFEAVAPDDDIWSGSVIELQKSHRFSADRGLGLSVAAMRTAGDELSALEADGMVSRMAEDQSGELAIADLPSWINHDFERLLLDFVKNIQIDFYGKNKPYLSFLREQSVERAYELFNKFRIICVHRSGYYGAEMINALLERSLHGGGQNGFYQGRPIIINENNYAMELFNGDTGIIWPDATGELKAFFPADSAGHSGFRSFNLHLLPAHSPAYAITVHKAQGSGFQQVLIITPPELSPLMTREMLYTAVSRAEKRAVFWGKRQLLAKSLQRVTRRYSNLSSALK